MLVNIFTDFSIVYVMMAAEKLDEYVSIIFQIRGSYRELAVGL